MAKGPKGEKRPADVNRRAFDVVRIASGQVEEKAEHNAAAELASKGGKARAAALSKKKRTEIAKAAAKKRWST